MCNPTLLSKRPYPHKLLNFCKTSKPCVNKEYGFEWEPLKPRKILTPLESNFENDSTLY